LRYLPAEKPQNEIKNKVARIFNQSDKADDLDYQASKSPSEQF